jgi:hypothetical protein
VKIKINNNVDDFVDNGSQDFLLKRGFNQDNDAYTKDVSDVWCIIDFWVLVQVLQNFNHDWLISIETFPGLITLTIGVY